MPFVYKVNTATFDIPAGSFFQNTSGSHDWVGRPNLLALANGTWILSYRSADTHGAVAGSLLHIRFSVDQGRNWSAEDTLPGGMAVTGFPISAHADDAAEGSLGQCANGDILLIVLENSTTGRNGSWQWRSTDNGATWSDGGQIDTDDELLAGGEIKLIGSDLYATFWRDQGAGFAAPYSVELWFSNNDGAAWGLVSEVFSTATGCNESALVHTGGTNLLVIARSDSQTETYLRRSTDLGNSWGAIEDVTAILGIVHRPRLRYFGSRLYLSGRDRVGGGAEEYSSLWYSDDDGATASWIGPFHWEPPDGWADGAYCDILERDGGDIYGMTYGGSTEFSAALWEYDAIQVLR